MAEQMSAREAWALTKRYLREIEVSCDDEAWRGSAWQERERLARACAIVEAKIDEHEKLVALHFMAYPDWSSKQRASIAWLEAFEKVRALERGEESK